MGRRNRKPEQLWAPQNVVRIRAELARGYHNAIVAQTRSIHRYETNLDQIAPILDEGVLQDVRPDLHMELEEDQEAWADQLTRLRSERAYARIAAAVLRTFTPMWLPPPSISAVRSTPVDPRDTTQAAGLGNAGFALFSEPVDRITERVCLFDPTPTAIGIDGILWWSLGDDPSDGSSDSDDDVAPLRPEATVMHILTRSRSTSLIPQLNPWYESTLTDVTSIVVPRRSDATVPEQEELGPVVTFMQRLGAAQRSAALRLDELTLPPGKQSYERSGWEALPPLRSLNVIAAA